MAQDLDEIIVVGEAVRLKRVVDSGGILLSGAFFTSNLALLDRVCLIKSSILFLLLVTNLVDSIAVCENFVFFQSNLLVQNLHFNSIDEVNLAVLDTCEHYHLVKDFNIVNTYI